MLKVTRPLSWREIVTCTLTPSTEPIFKTMTLIPTVLEKGKLDPVLFRNRVDGERDKDAAVYYPEIKEKAAKMFCNEV